MYRAPGDAIDYAYGIADIRWSYSAELRDTGTVGGFASLQTAQKVHRMCFRRLSRMA